MNIQGKLDNLKKCIISKGEIVVTRHNLGYEPPYIHKLMAKKKIILYKLVVKN